MLIHKTDGENEIKKKFMGKTSKQVFSVTNTINSLDMALS